MLIVSKTNLKQNVFPFPLFLLRRHREKLDPQELCHIAKEELLLATLKIFYHDQLFVEAGSYM